MRRTRLVVTALALATAFGPAFGLAAVIKPDPGVGQGALDHIVFGASGPELRTRGYTVIDEYGPFTTARITSADAASLSTEGFLVVLLDHRTGRGSYVADFTKGDGGIPASLKADASASHHLVQFRGPVKAAWRDALAANALAVYDYLPHNAALARLDSGGRAALLALPYVRDVEPYHPGFKLAPGLPTTGATSVVVGAWRDADRGAVAGALAALGGTVTAEATTSLEHLIAVDIAGSALHDVARLADVSFVEPATGPITTDNAQASAITQGGSLDAWPVHDRGIDGRSQVTSVCDSGVNTDPVSGAAPWDVRRMRHEMHDDGGGLLQINADSAPLPEPLPPHGKVALYFAPQEPPGVYRGNGDDEDGHGTHTAGTLAGDAPPYGVRNGNDGVAFASKLVVCDIHAAQFHVLLDYSNYWKPAYAAGARVNSNSWGSPHNNNYGLPARQHDAYVWDHRDFLITRSMGNTGANGNMRPEAVAKSAMGIGGSLNGANADTIYSSSSPGFAADGRVKPNAIAPASCLTSSYLSGEASYSCRSGTSMSTPTVAGAATLVRDYFERGFYPGGTENAANALNPSAALVRAVLQVSGREITNDRNDPTFPNRHQGWGRVTLEDALYFAGEARNLLVVDEGAALRTGDVWTRQVEVGPGQPLRVMLAWSDLPALPLANPALVNDLHLEVVGPAGTYVGNAFAGSEVPPGQGSPDLKNVEEAVYIVSPVPGTYTVRVTAGNAALGQPFALVATGNLAWSGPATLHFSMM